MNSRGKVMKTKNEVRPHVNFPPEFLNYSIHRNIEGIKELYSVVPNNT
jgi:hypothetical protein